MKARLLLCWMMLMGIHFAGATIRLVPSAYSTIQAAISASVNGDTVLVYPGIYHENINFRGKGIVVASRFLVTRDTSFIESTVIDGSQPVQPDTASCVIIRGTGLASSVDSSAALIGFRITGGTGTRWDDEHNPGHKYREGGGILIQYSSPRILFNHISYNQATDMSDCVSAGGGAIRCGDGNPKIRNNVIDHNHGRYGAGLVFNYSGAEMSNNVITMNTGGEDYGGGGIWAYGLDGLSRERNVVNNTIVYNSSSSGGGGIRVWSTTMVLTNNIIYNNSAPNNPQIQPGGTVQVTYSDVQGGFTGSGNMDSDPLFDPVDYYLSPASMCIDAGDSNSAYNDPADNGNPERAKFPARGGIRNDMGAYGGPGSSLMANIPSIMSGAVQYNGVPAFRLFPNPARDSVRITLPDKLTSGSIIILEAFSQNGTAVLRKELKPGQGSTDIDVSGLIPGIYLFRLDGGGQYIDSVWVVKL